MLLDNITECFVSIMLQLPTSEKSSPKRGPTSGRRGGSSSEMSSQKKCMIVTGLLVAITFLAGKSFL